MIPIADRHSEYAHRVREDLRRAGLRADVRHVQRAHERQNPRCAVAEIASTPVVGDREAEAEAVAVRTRACEDLKAMPLFQFIDRLLDEVATAMDPESACPTLRDRHNVRRRQRAIVAGVAIDLREIGRCAKPALSREACRRTRRDVPPSRRCCTDSVRSPRPLSRCRGRRPSFAAVRRSSRRGSRW